MFKQTILALIFLAFVTDCGIVSEHDNLGSVDGKDCAALKTVFLATYYPVFRNNCVSCHDDGNGFGHFANVSSDVAFQQFESLGRSTVEANFINPNHQPGHTGPQNQGIIDSSAAQWSAAESICSLGATPGVQVVSTSKSFAAIYTTAYPAFTTMSWDLASQVSAADQGRFHVRMTMDVRESRVTMNNSTSITGYEFRNPTATLETGGVAYELNGFRILLNGTLLNNMTTYAYTILDVNANTPSAAAPSGAVGPAVLTPASTDQFAIRIDGISVP